MRRGQAMLETLLAVFLVTFLFLVSDRVMRMLSERIMLDHAAARAARARAVGMNDFMCMKSAKVAMIPVSGRRIWPTNSVDEVARVPIYLCAKTPEIANNVLEYAKWNDTTFAFSSGDGGLAPLASARLTMHARFDSNGAAMVESHYPLYMENNGW